MRIGLSSRRFGLVRLRVDDDVGQEQIVVAGVLKIGFQRGRASRIVIAEGREAHSETGQRGGDMIRRTADHAA